MAHEIQLFPIRAVVLLLANASESLGKPEEAQIAGLHSQQFLISRSVVSDIYNNFLGGANATLSTGHIFFFFKEDVVGRSLLIN